jgi:ATP-dependent Lon protease
MKLHFVDTMDQVLQLALESPLPKIEDEAAQSIAPPLTSTTPDSPAAHQ